MAWLPTLLGLGPGDVVVMPPVCYPTYEVGARLAGATVVRADSLTALGPDPRVRLVWVNSPGNPTGRVLPAAHLRKVVDWARERGAVVASDECYLPLGWDAEPVSVLSPEVCGGSYDGVLAVHSLSKRSNLAGYRAGFVAGDPALVAELLEVRKHAGMIVPAPVQAAMVAALRDEAHADGAAGAVPGPAGAAASRRSPAPASRIDALRGRALPLGDPRRGLLGHAWTGWRDAGILVAPGVFYGPGRAPARTGRADRVRRARRRGRRRLPGRGGWRRWMTRSPVRVAVVGTGLIGGSVLLRLRAAGARRDRLGPGSGDPRGGPPPGPDLRRRPRRRGPGPGRGLPRRAAADAAGDAGRGGRGHRRRSACSPTWAAPRPPSPRRRARRGCRRRFVPGHPMAGAERAGLTAADPDLLRRCGLGALSRAGRRSVRSASLAALLVDVFAARVVPMSAGRRTTGSWRSPRTCRTCWPARWPGRCSRLRCATRCSRSPPAASATAPGSPATPAEADRRHAARQPGQRAASSWPRCSAVLDDLAAAVRAGDAAGADRPLRARPGRSGGRLTGRYVRPTGGVPGSPADPAGGAGVPA